MKKVDDDKVFWARDNETVKIPTKREEMGCLCKPLKKICG